jgi:hypothetical protein
MRVEWARNVTSMGKRRNAYSVLVGMPEIKRPPRMCRWEHTVTRKMGLAGVSGNGKPGFIWLRTGTRHGIL